MGAATRRSIARAQPRVGCSGWNYKAWRIAFYPERLPARRWLEFYASRFDTVEVNNTFYRLPERATFAAWHRQAPPDFLFSVKASRFLTHMKRLREPEEPLARFFSRASAFSRQLGPVLYQLPGNFTIDLGRLEAFLDALPRLSSGRRIRHVMEFRHPSWYSLRDVSHAQPSRRCALPARQGGLGDCRADRRSVPLRSFSRHERPVPRKLRPACAHPLGAPAG